MKNKIFKTIFKTRVSNLFLALIVLLVGTKLPLSSCEFAENSHQHNNFSRINQTFLEKIGFLSDREILNYLKYLTERLVSVSDYPGRKYELRLLKDSGVNAYAAPKNKIYISLGLIARSQTEDQLAGIIAHEIAHLTQEHSKIQTERIKSLLVKVNLLNQILGLLDFHSESILSNSLFLVDKFILNLYQRQHEIEADAIAVKNLQRASWRVEEFSKFFEELRENKLVSDQRSIFSSHPSLTRRLELINQKINTQKSANLGASKQKSQSKSKYFKRIRQKAQAHLRKISRRTNF